MLPTTLDTSFTLQNFFSFFSQIMFEKERALADALPSESEDENVGTEGKVERLARYISGQLSALLEEQALVVLREGGEFSALYFRQAQYIMAALGDEIFLNFSWEGQSVWDTTLIEMQVFGTQIAGTKFFADLDEFLATRDPLKIDIGALYYFALSLGFRGKYRGIEDHGAIKAYKEQLFLFILRRKPQLLQGKESSFLKPTPIPMTKVKFLSYPTRGNGMWL